MKKLIASFALIALLLANVAQSGATSLNGGLLNIANTSALSGTVQFDGGGLQFGAPLTVTNAMSFNAASNTIDTQGYNSTLTGVISGLGGLTKMGSGVLTLTESNTFSGLSNINQGTVNVANSSALGTSNVAFNGGGLQFGAPVTLVNNLMLNAPSNTFDTQNYNTALSGTISGSGGLTQIGNGALALSGANTYTGGTNLNGGILNIANTAGLGTGLLAINGGVLQVGTSGTIVNSMSFNGVSNMIDTQGFNSTLSGVISGLGGLTKLGSGTLTLTGMNSFSGLSNINQGTVNVANSRAFGPSNIAFNGGNMQFGAPVALANGMTLNAPNTTFDTQSFNAILSGAIGGAGTLAKIGNGTLVLSGINTYSGGTSLLAGTLNDTNVNALGTGSVGFNGGALQFGAPITVANAMSFNAVSNTIDTQGFNSTVTGLISGLGGLTKMGSGTLILPGANSFGGQSNINEGTVNIQNSAALGSSVVNFNGGTLQFGAPMTVANSLVLNAPNSTVDTQSVNASLTGGISGSGGLNQIGNGTLALSGVNTYTGGTTVNSGTLLLMTDNTLPSAGALTINNNGTVDMQSTRQTVASLAGAGTLRMGLPLSGGPYLNVTGNANFTGTILSPSFAVQNITNQEKFTVINYGSYTGAFKNIISPAAIALTPTYNANNLVLTATFVPFNQIASTPNQNAVGNALQSARTSASSQVQAVMNSLYSLNGPQLQTAFDQIGPISLATMSGVSRASSMVQATAVGQRMVSLADGSDSGQFSMYAANDQSTLPGQLLAAAGISDTTMFDTRGKQDAGPSQSPWGFFASAAGTAGSLSGVNSGSGLTPGYAFNSGGITGGADYKFTDHFVAGTSLGYLHGHASIYSPGSGTVDNNSTRYGTYGTLFDERWRVNLYLGGAFDVFNTYRGIPFVGQMATASPIGNEFNAQTSASYDFLLPWLTVSPFAGLNYDRLMVNSFQETGAGAWDLDVNSETSESLRSSLGLRFAKAFDWDSHVWTPYASFGWLHEFDSQERPIDAQLASGTGTPFSVNTADTARNDALVGAGVSVKLSDSILVKFNYNGDYRYDFRDNSLDADIRYRF